MSFIDQLTNLLLGEELLVMRINDENQVTMAVVAQSSQYRGNYGRSRQNYNQNYGRGQIYSSLGPQSQLNL